jgi:hypothetical protein
MDGLAAVSTRGSTGECCSTLSSSTTSINKKKTRMDDGTQPPGPIFTFDVDNQEARTRLVQQRKRDPFFISFFLPHRLTFLCYPFVLLVLLTLFFSFSPPAALQPNTQQKNTNPAPTNKEFDHGSNAFCTNHRQALVCRSRQAFRIWSLCHARMANQYHQSCQTLLLFAFPESRLLLLSLIYCACVILLFFLYGHVPGDPSWFLLHDVLLFLYVFLQTYKPIISIGHRAVLSLTLRHACSCLFSSYRCLFLLIAMEGMLKVVTTMSRYLFFFKTTILSTNVG